MKGQSRVDQIADALDRVDKERNKLNRDLRDPRVPITNEVVLQKTETRKSCNIIPDLPARKVKFDLNMTSGFMTEYLRRFGNEKSLAPRYINRTVREPDFEINEERLIKQTEKQKLKKTLLLKNENIDNEPDTYLEAVEYSKRRSKRIYNQFMKTYEGNFFTTGFIIF